MSDDTTTPPDAPRAAVPPPTGADLARRAEDDLHRCAPATCHRWAGFAETAAGFVSVVEPYQGPPPEFADWAMGALPAWIRRAAASEAEVARWKSDGAGLARDAAKDLAYVDDIAREVGIAKAWWDVGRATKDNVSPCVELAEFASEALPSWIRRATAAEAECREWRRQFAERVRDDMDAGGKHVRQMLGAIGEGDRLREENARLRRLAAESGEGESAMYATVCAVADSLGLKVWGCEELAPAVARLREVAAALVSAHDNGDRCVYEVADMARELLKREGGA